MDSAPENTTTPETDGPDDEAPGASGVGRRQPCPCGSGKKFKNCCDGKATIAPRVEPGAVQKNAGPAKGMTGHKALPKMPTKTAFQAPPKQTNTARRKV